ncbi:MAG: sulfatase-like hydrolase/transferase [Sphingobacteriia bacterium]|jgi:arylsulfatase A-like enzyme
MNLKLIIFFLLLSQFCLAQKKPNIIFIMVDDMGYADLGCYGSKINKTPNIDQMAKDGVKLTQAYSAAPVCTPSRTAFMTGRYPARTTVGLYEPLNWSSSDSLVGLSAETPSLPNLIKKAGYTTHLIGKWHLGFIPKFSPRANGFDSFFGYHGGGVDYISHTDPGGNLDLYENEQPINQKGYSTDLFAERAVSIIQQKHQQPYFLSVQFNAPHWPWQAPGAAVYPLGDKEAKQGGSIEIYKAMIESLDIAVGKIVAAVKASGQADNTLIVFTSDNGGERFSDMGGFKEKKFVLWEGGIREPALVVWPKKIKAGTISDQPTIHMDFTATILAAAKGIQDPVYPMDGINLLPLLKTNKTPFARTFYWRVFQRNQQKAIRLGDWKYLQTEKEEFLFNLKTDPFEDHNVKTENPTIFNQLKEQYANWEKQVLKPIPLAKN